MKPVAGHFLAAALVFAAPLAARAQQTPASPTAEQMQKLEEATSALVTARAVHERTGDICRELAAGNDDRKLRQCLDLFKQQTAQLTQLSQKLAAILKPLAGGPDLSPALKSYPRPGQRLREPDPQ